MKYENLAPFFLRKRISNRVEMSNILDKATEIYKKNKLHWMLVISDHLLNLKLYKLLHDKKLTFLEESIAMVFDFENIKNINLKERENKKEIKNNINIQLVNHNLQDWVGILVAAFDSTEAIMTEYGKTHGQALKDKAQFYHFVLYANNTPISCLTLSIEESRARIDDVGTVPEFQGKGYASCLIYDVLQRAKQLGVNKCFLEASEKSLVVYQKIGFSTIFKNSIYEYIG
jgi:GNAT superfamily N-acetyltransferase